MFLLGLIQMNGLSVFNAIYSSAHLRRDAKNLTAPPPNPFISVNLPRAFHSAASFCPNRLFYSIVQIPHSFGLLLLLTPPPPDSVLPCLWARQVKTVGAADRIRLSGRFSHKLPVANKACGCNYYTGSQSHLGPARPGEAFPHAEREQTEATGRGENWSVGRRESRIHTINRGRVQQGTGSAKIQVMIS